MYFANRAAVEARPFSASNYHIKAFKYDDYAPKLGNDKLMQIKVATVIFEGDDDVITTPPEACRLHRGIEKSDLFMIKDAGHFPWLEQPATFL